MVQAVPVLVVATISVVAVGVSAYLGVPDMPSPVLVTTVAVPEAARPCGLPRHL